LRALPDFGVVNTPAENARLIVSTRPDRSPTRRPASSPRRAPVSAANRTSNSACSAWRARRADTPAPVSFATASSKMTSAA
jgi:hypothetical protein